MNIRFQMIIHPNKQNVSVIPVQKDYFTLYLFIN